jgi:hypothetical protein
MSYNPQHNEDHDNSSMTNALNAFIDDLKHDPERMTQGDKFYFDRLRWIVSYMPEAQDRLDLYGSILRLIPKKSNMHRFMADDTLAMALQPLENGLDPQSGLSALLVSASYFTPGTDEHLDCYQTAQHLVKYNHLHDEEHAIALHFLIGQPPANQSTNHYQKLWEDHVKAIPYPDEHYSILSHALSYDVTYPTSFLHILSGQLNDSIHKHGWEPHTTHELIQNMINRSDADQLLQAFWCRTFHANNVKNAWEDYGDPDYEGISNDLTPADTQSNNTSRQELADLYQRLEHFTTYASLAKERRSTNKTFIKKRTHKILSFEDQDDRTAALLYHARNALLCQNEGDDEGELIHAHIMDRVISRWTHNKKTAQNSFHDTVTERRYITSLFTHPDTQSSAVLHFMNNKMAQYDAILLYAHDDTTLSKRDEFAINRKSFIDLPEFITSHPTSALAIEN